MRDPKVVVDKSTVPVGTADRVRAAIAEELAARGASIPFAVASNPEFLKEGAAVEDFMRPDRVVIGASDERAIAALRAVYAPFMRNHERFLVMDVRSAELTKYAANAMLATRISFMNELANLADRLGADIEMVRQGIGSDPRIGYHFLYPGVGYGGSCFPKDVKALQYTASEFAHPLQVLAAVEAVNDAQKRVLVDKIVARLGADLAGRTIALWGLAFKPNTDDMREAPSRVIVDALAALGARIVAYDPVAMDEAKRVFGDAPHLAYRDVAAGRVRRRRRARRRHRVEGIPQPRLRRAEAAAEVAAGLRRPQPLRPARGSRGRARVLRHRARGDVGNERRPLRNVHATPSRGRRCSSSGDVMLDRYWFGDVERISPEAPVPVVKVARTEERPGGAANVARNAAALGARATLLSVVGDDEPGAALAQLLAAERVTTSFLTDPAHRDDGEAARDRPPAAAAAHRLRDRAVARGARRQARRLRAAAARRGRRRAVRLRQGRPRAHRDDDRARARGGQARARRSQGRRLLAVPRRDAAHAQPHASSARWRAAGATRPS